MEGKEIVMPNEVLSLAIGMGSKLIIAFVLNYPQHTQQEVADMLGTSRRNVAKAVALAKVECEHLFTQCEQLFTKREHLFTPHLVVEEVKGKQEIKPKPMPLQTPSLDEVRAYAEGAGRPDIADEFFHVNTDNDWLAADGTRVANWKRWFRGYAKRTPTQSEGKAKRKKSMSMEDMRYLSDYETQTQSKK
tara:strand:- start:2575 stop:3144 length:570 start_codon:yes stop_codon:yes gene_type:complete